MHCGDRRHHLRLSCQTTTAEWHPGVQQVREFDKFVVAGLIVLTMSGRTRQLLYRGILVTINTGLWTAVLSIIDLVLVRTCLLY